MEINDAMRKLVSSQVASVLFISLLVFTVTFGLRHIRKLESLELAAYDWLIRMNQTSSEMNPHIAIIGISEDDFRTYGWPLTDARLAEALMMLSRYQPRVIGVDIFRDFEVPPGSDSLKSVWQNNPHIIGVMLGFGANDGIPPPFPLKNSDPFDMTEGQVGFNDMLVDSGGTVRRGLLFIDNGKDFFYSFALRLALLHLKKEGIYPVPDPLNPHWIKLGQTTLKPFGENDGGYVRAEAAGYQFLIDFQESSSLFQIISLSDLYIGKVNPDQLRDKIVLVGVIARSVKDIFYTPLSRSAQPKQQVPGVVLHAHMVSQLLRYGHNQSTAIQTFNQTQEILWMLLWCFMGSAVGNIFRSPWYFSLTALAILTGLILAVNLLFSGGLWIPMVPPIISFVLSSTLAIAVVSNREKRQRTLLMNLFSRQVSSEIAKVIWKNRDKFSDGSRPRPQQLNATVFCLNLEKLNTVSGERNAPYLVEWINAYIESSIRFISQFGGIVDNCESDRIKANFGFPMPRNTEEQVKEDAINAIDCALAIEKEVKQLNTAWQTHGYPPVSARIGIASGKIFAAALGHKERLKYTTVGHPVSMAANLERYDKDFIRDQACRILISEKTLSYTNRQFKIRKFAADSLGSTNHKMTIFHVLGRVPNTDQDTSRR